jgi:hypothetical protein
MNISGAFVNARFHINRFYVLFQYSSDPSIDFPAAVIIPEKNYEVHVSCMWISNPKSSSTETSPPIEIEEHGTTTE